MPSASIFLSYSRRQPDESWAARIVAILTGRYRCDVWVDKRGIAAGRPFDEEILRAIAASDTLLFLGSSSSLVSPYCRQECETALNQGKRFVPLFIEPVGWPGFPERFHGLHYVEVFRAADEIALAAVVGRALLGAGVAIDAALVPAEAAAFDEWAAQVHPDYRELASASEARLREFVEECSRKLALRSEHGHHNLNLALLLLHLNQHERALRHAEIALKELPSSPEAAYYCALVQSARDTLSLAPRGRIQTILALCEAAIRLEAERGWPGRIAMRPLALALKAVVVQDHFLRNGLLSPVGEARPLIEEARAAGADAFEVKRMMRTIPGLSGGARGLLEPLGG